jgi:hypothetical protein
MGDCSPYCYTCRGNRHNEPSDTIVLVKEYLDEHGFKTNLDDLGTLVVFRPFNNLYKSIYCGKAHSDSNPHKIKVFARSTIETFDLHDPNSLPGIAEHFIGSWTE